MVRIGGPATGRAQPAAIAIVDSLDHLYQLQNINLCYDSMAGPNG